MNASRLVSSLSVAAIVVATAACAPNQQMPLFFGQTQTFGVSMHGSTTEQGASLTVGFRDYDIAIVPVTLTQKDGTTIPLQSQQPQLISESKGLMGTNIDALSVFGQFNGTADQIKMNVSLGKFSPQEVRQEICLTDLLGKWRSPLRQPL